MSIIAALRNREANGTDRDLYSFATKYCSHHQPKYFPIYDSYVHKVLNYFYVTHKAFAANLKEIDAKLTRLAKTADDIENGTDVPLRRDYKTFKDLIVTFQGHYNLTNYDLKQIDQYLWQLGKDWFPNQYQGQSKDTKSLKEISDGILNGFHCLVDVRSPKHVEFNKAPTNTMREIGRKRAAMLILDEYGDGWKDALRHRGLEVE